MLRSNIILDPDFNHSRRRLRSIYWQVDTTLLMEILTENRRRVLTSDGSIDINYGDSLAFKI